MILIRFIMDVTYTSTGFHAFAIESRTCIPIFLNVIPRVSLTIFL